MIHCIRKKILVWINKIVKFNKGYENHSKLWGGGDVIHARRNK